MQEEYIREITLLQMLKVIKINARVLLTLMLIIASLIIGISVAINSLKEKIYETTGAIQINNYVTNNFAEEQTILSDNKSSSIANVPPGATIATRSEIEQALIKTGYILMPVIKKNHLDIKVTPIGLPVIGPVLDSICKKIDEDSETMYGYCHGRIGLISISEFNVPDKYLNKKFILKIVTPNSYELYDNQQFIFSGEVGKVSSSKNISLKIDSIVPKPGTKFILSKLSIDKAVIDLSQHIILEPVIVGKNFVPPITGILKISMSGDNPKLQANVINDIIDQLTQTALKQQSSLLNSSIDFINKQINDVSIQLKKSQAEMVKFQATNNVISLDSQERQYIQQLSDVEKDILDNKISINQFDKLYAPKHPLMINLYTQRDYLAAKKSTLDNQLKQIPKDEAIYLNLKRDLDIYQQLYSFLLNKDRELQMKLSSITSPVEILYYASPNVAADIQEISYKLIAVSLTIIFVIILIVFLNLVFFGNSDPWLMSEISKTPLLTVIPYLKNKKNNRGFELIASYLLQKVQTKPLIVNISNISAHSGKTYILQTLIKHLTGLNKTCLFMHFGNDNNFKKLKEIIPFIENIDSDKITNYNELKINQTCAMDTQQMSNLITKLAKFDFIFIKSPLTEESALFLHLTKLAQENFLIVTPKDTRNKMEWLVNDMINLNANVTQIIYNNPRKTIVQSLYAVETYHK